MIAKVEGFAALAVLAFFGVVAIVVYRYIKKAGGIGGAAVNAGVALKENTPLGIPARVIDAGVSKATGRNETLGGFLAETFDPTTRAANTMLNSPPPIKATSSAPSVGQPDTTPAEDAAAFDAGMLGAAP